MERYDPIRVLGEGSFGKVYLMRDKVKRSLLCVKVIKIKNIPKKEREATKMEVDLLRRLHHPNIVRYIDSFLSKNQESLCICMEFCDGGDLASQVKAARRNLFSESKILHWFVQIALGLHYMHYNRVLHRDLKTQNVFLLGNGRLVLGDLGISKVLDGTMDFAQTCIGTPYYMSPEIFKNKPYSYKSDVWALGCVLYEMTTLNHAFDATSLNGLAGKIIKGKYPAISTKYSKYLRDLISDMLMTEPKQRPDLDQILRKPFIQKHIVNFFCDIANRPSTGISEGTMIVRAAVGAAANVNLANDHNMLSLKKQLESLDMMAAVTEALSPKAAPETYMDAKKLAKEQSSALKREEDHRKMVEAALEKLRLERENKAAERAAQQQQQQGVRAGGGIGVRAPPAVGPSGRPGYQPQPSQQQQSQLQQQQQQQRPVGVGQIQRGVSSVSVGSNDGNNNKAPPNSRRPSFGEDVAAKERAERMRLADQEKRRLLADQEARERERAEERRREELRHVAEARAREEAALQRARDEAAAKQRQDQLKAQEDAAARREALRERERARQRMEIDQLRKDKLELDRKLQEQEQVRQQRQTDERRRLIDAKQSSSNSNISNADEDKMSFGGGGAAGGRYPRNGGALIAEEKGDPSMLSDRDRVMARKQEKLAREEADRLEALREAEADYRRLRVHANQQNLSTYQTSDTAAGALPNANPKRVSAAAVAAGVGVGVSVGMGGGVGGGAGRRGEPSYSVEDSKYDFDHLGDRDRRKQRPSVGDVDELADRLTEATKGKQSRYEAEAPRPPARVAAVAAVAAMGGHDTDDDDDGDIWEAQQAVGPSVSTDLDEDFQRRELELQEELQIATMRCEELKRTLNETKTIIGSKQNLVDGIAGAGAAGPRQSQSRDPYAGHGDTSGRGRAPNPQDPIAEVDGAVSDYDDDDLSDDFEDSWQQAEPAKPPRGPGLGPGLGYESKDDSVITTPRRGRPAPVAIKESPYVNLQDPPTPSGRLGDRIDRLRVRCIEALGKEAFQDAYSYLKRQDDYGLESRGGIFEDDQEEEKVSRLRAILGDNKAHYGSLIEQLIFMEETIGH